MQRKTQRENSGLDENLDEISRDSMLVAHVGGRGGNRTCTDIDGSALRYDAKGGPPGALSG